MNRPLRKTHLVLIAGLTPVAVAIFAASISVRRSVPPSGIPAALQESLPPMQEIGRRLIRAEGFEVEVRGLMDQNGKRFLEFKPLKDPHVADLLAYIGPGKKDAFDQSVRLLGQVYASCPVRFPLPEDSTQTLSEIYLYSGASKEVVGRVNLVDSGQAAP